MYNRYIFPYAFLPRIHLAGHQNSTTSIVCGRIIPPVVCCRTIRTSCEYVRTCVTVVVQASAKTRPLCGSHRWFIPRRRDLRQTRRFRRAVWVGVELFPLIELEPSKEGVVDPDGMREKRVIVSSHPTESCLRNPRTPRPRPPPASSLVGAVVDSIPQARCGAVSVQISGE